MLINDYKDSAILHIRELKRGVDKQSRLTKIKGETLEEYNKRRKAWLLQKDKKRGKR